MEKLPIIFLGAFLWRNGRAAFMSAWGVRLTGLQWRGPASYMETTLEALCRHIGLRVHAAQP